jgi:hypothetical protein
MTVEYREGAAAYGMGLSIKANPYSPGEEPEKCWRWREGFLGNCNHKVQEQLSWSR